MKHTYWLLLILFVSSSALAQTGSLRGQVTDQNGGSVPGAKVTVNSVSGAINKRASFFLDVRRDEVDNGSIINAITLDPQTLAIINPFTDVFRTRQRRFGINPRIDYQLNAKNTLTVRYGFTHADIQGAGSISRLVAISMARHCSMAGPEFRPT